MKKAMLVLLSLMLIATLAGCNNSPVTDANTDSGFESVFEDVSQDATDSEDETELSTSEGDNRQDASKNGAETDTADSGANKTPSKEPEKQTSVTSKPEEKKQSDPKQESEPQTPVIPSEPPAKSIYDRPYDINAIEKDMEQYVIGKGGNYKWSLNMDNCGHWADPLPTSAKWSGDKLRNTIRDDIDVRMSLGHYSNFRVYFKPISGGEYEVIVLCG